MKYRTWFFDQIRRRLAYRFVDERLAQLMSRFPESFLLRKVIPGTHLYKKGSVRTASRYGVNFFFDLSDYPDWSLYYSNPIDSSRTLLNFVKLGDVVFDIG